MIAATSTMPHSIDETSGVLQHATRRYRPLPSGSITRGSPILVVFFSLIALLAPARADRRTDIARLGEYYTSLPLYRSGSGTNVLPVAIGNPEQQINLTLSESCFSC